MRAAIVLLLAALAAGPARAGERPVDYAFEVRPLLSDRCFRCHGPDKQHRKGGLRLDTADGIREARDEILARILSDDDDDRMPPPDAGPRLTDAEIALVRRWLAEGAAWRPHWAFSPVTRPEPPPVTRTAWPRNPVDRFVLARLEAAGLSPSPEADRATLVRRVSLDLVGLPPGPAEVAAFVADRRPDAYERLVDRLLASPHHGERWGRHWLDLARYADSNGYSIDSPRSVWKYRDWVVAALNRDLPFDRFVTEQIAGDLLPAATVEQKIATGFHRNTPFNEEGGIDPEQFRVEAVADRVATTGSVLLGLTLGCARCHDHKYDPVSQEEFFQLFAFFNDQDEPVLELGSPEEIARAAAVRPRIKALAADLKAREAAWLKSLSEAERREIPQEISVIMALGAEQRDERQRRMLHDYLGPRAPGFRERLAALEALRARDPRYPTALVLAERPAPRETRVHVMGDFTRLGERVEPQVPAVLPPLPPTDGRPTRLDLARWLSDPAHPLVGRVLVNRLWQQYFGLGIVETENDFGMQGALPTHPELLDWLASELWLRGGSLKAMHRLIVTSATYRQSSRHRADLAARDPLNRLLGRQNRLRLEAEIIRDSALAASGLLDRRIGGPPVFPPQPDGVFGFTQIPRVWTASTGPDRFRRGLYTHIWRSAPHPALAVFDAPDGQAPCTRRNRSTTPLQALTLLNGEAFVEMAGGLASRVLRERRAGERARIERAFRLALGRPPTAAEASRLAQLLGDERGAGATAPAAWIALARVILNLDEFITRE